MTTPPDRWDRLFADLAGSWGAEQAAEDRAEVVDRTRAEIGKLRLVDRLRPALGAEITVRVSGLETLRGALCDVGSDWLMVSEPAGVRCLVPLASVLSIGGLSAVSATPGSEGAVGARLDLRYALRGLSRDRTPVLMVLSETARVTGTVDRVGADFVELAEHDIDDPRRRAAVRATHTVPVGAIRALRSR